MPEIPAKNWIIRYNIHKLGHNAHQSKNECATVENEEDWRIMFETMRNKMFNEHDNIRCLSMKKRNVKKNKSSCV